MSRPIKKKTIGKMPTYTCFTSHDTSLSIQLTVEEYETIRLIDYLGYSQEACSQEMNIARSSVVTLYKDARKKLARFLIEGHNLEIIGGNYQLEDQQKGDIKNMKIAVTCVDGQIFQHFGRCPSFLICIVEGDKIVSTSTLDTNDLGCSLLAEELSKLGVDVVICGGIGMGARNHIEACGMEVFPGASGDALAQVESYISGSLDYDPDTSCDHHEHSHCQSEHRCH